MIIHANTPVHPLQRPGVQQRERLLQALIPGNLRLDDRSMQELIAFSGKFAEQVRFWNANNQAQGDWTPFWESDVTTLFAMMAAVDLENLRTEYRSLELQYLRLLKAELENPDSIKSDSPTAARTIREMVVLIYKLALKVAEFCQKAPAEHPLHHEYQRIVSTQLQAPLKALIAFHKGSEKKILLDEYAAFIGNSRAAGAWGLPTSEDFLCIDFVLPDESREELWRLFLQFYRALALMADKASRAFRSALRSRDDHAPHITLFLTFLHLFRHLQDEMNRLPERHLQFYYEDVLRLEQRRVIPDKVHVVFELAQDLERYRLKKDTLFGGGTDQSGKLRVYGLEDEVAVGKVKLVERKNYYELNNVRYVLPIALTDASKKDGIGLEYKDGEKAWHPFSGLRALEWQYKHQRKEIFPPEKIESLLYMDLPLTKTRFIVSSPLFKHNGEVNISLQFPDSTENSEIGKDIIYEAIEIFNKEITNPCYVIYPNPIWFINFFEKTKKIELNKILFKVTNKHVKGLSIQNGDTVFPEQAKITLIGGASGSTEIIYIRVEELFNRPITTIVKSLVDVNGTEIKNNDITWHYLNDSTWNDLNDNITVASYNYDIPEKYNSKTKSGFIRLKIKLSKNEIFSFTSDQIKICYETTVSYPGAREENLLFNIYHVHPFGFSKIEPIVSGNLIIPLFPKYEQPGTTPLTNQTDILDKQPAHGNLFLGFESLLPNQTLNLLFKMAEGSGNPDHLAPEVIWSYLRDNDWVRFPPQFILKDETKGMKQTGIIRFQIPEDINNGNTWIKGKEDRTDLFWLRASATEFPDDKILVDALPMLVDIHVNAGTAVFQDDGNSPEHLEPGLPAETINALRFRDVHVKRVEQPYTSFGGRLSEAGDRHAYYRRIHERLRHRQRAVSAWDYERLVLEEFPKVALAKCLTHTQVVAAGMPGHVTLAVVPYPDKMTGDRRYYPNLDAGDLEAMRRYLSRHNSYFVGGYGSPGFCGCHDEEHAAAGSHECHCGCGHDHSRLSVINARFEPVRLQVCVRFHAGKDIPYYTKQLNEDLKTFLAPWATDQHKPLLFGTSLSTTNLLLFLENLDYVDVVMNLKIKHFASRTSADYGEGELPWSAPDTIVPLTAASLLTTYLNRLDEDNPNVLDHEINVIADQDGCACKTCLLEKVRLFVEKLLRSTFAAPDLHTYLETLIKQGSILGEHNPSLCDPFDLQLGKPYTKEDNKFSYYWVCSKQAIILYLAIYSLERLESITIHKPA